jgi:hypothetical protein
LHNHNSVFQSTSIWILLWGLSLFFLILTSYYSFPISLRNYTDYPIFHYSSMFWPSLILFLVINLLAAFFTRNTTIYLLSSLSLSGIVFLEVYFYSVVAGPDTAFFDGITRAVAAKENLSPSLAGYPWPSSFILVNELSSLMKISVEQAGLLLFILLTIVVALVLSIYFKSLTSERVAILLPALYFIGFYGFVDWEMAPQTLALVTLLIFFLIIYPKTFSLSKLAIALLLCVSLVLSHPFLWIFLAGGLILVALYFRWRRPRDASTTKKDIPISFLLFSAALVYNIFFTYALVTDSLSAIEKPFGTGLVQLLGTFGSRVQYSATIAPNSNYLSLAYISDMVQVIIMAFSGISLFVWIYKRGLRKQEFAILFSAFAFLIGGAAIGFAWRSIQVGAILGVGGLAVALNYRRIRPFVIVLIAIGLLTIPVLTAHYSWYPYGDHVSPQSFVFLNYFGKYGIGSGSVSDNFLNGFADAAVTGYLQGFYQLYWRTPSPPSASQYNQNECLVQAKVVVVTPELGNDMVTRLGCSTTQVTAQNELWVSSMDLVFTSYGSSVIFLVSP